MRVKISRKEHFNAAHRLHNPAWNDARNTAVFGKCNNPNFHGHNYEVVANVTGEIDPESGFVIDMKVLKQLLKEEIIEPFDHLNLNLDVAEFKTLIPTAENIVVVIWKRLRNRLAANLDLSVTLYETERNYVEYSGK